MPTKSLRFFKVPDDRDEFLANVARLISTRKPRPVVTPSGKRARGNFPSIKAPLPLNYESLLELDVLRVAEVSSLVRAMRTHPVVLALPGQKVVHYTPDVLVEWSSGGALIETKATYFLKIQPSRDRILEVVRRLKANRVPLLLVVEGDVLAGGLQEELKELLRLRRCVGPRRQQVDSTKWDPLQGSPADGELERRWQAAQRECDELLRRVMRRDPGEFIASVR